MIRRIYQLVQANCQFIIATHSPIIMTYPDAVIYEINDADIVEKEYDQIEHFQVMRSFFDNPKRLIGMIIDEAK